MLWIINNMATIIICLILAAVVASIVAGMVRKNRKGQSSCGCGCSGCPMSGSCHQK
ncbi:MAG: FeoB-associated Cys-rich membrane protein [Clostridiaceae bacterium]|nr:FeoB-associated Cys-rich membrane protein [Clostridiaceae bacterium]